MENTPAFHPLDYVSVVRRRMWWLIVPAVLATVIGAALVMWLPREYSTRATLGVSMPAVSPDLIGRTQRVSPEERVAAITQGLKNPALLERIVKEEGLDKNTPTTDAIQALDRRTTIAIPPADPNLPPGTIVQFTVAYRDGDPQTTQRIANRLAELFVEDSSMRREMRAEDTATFVSMQLSESQRRLGELEARLRTAKESFMGALPEQTNANVAMVTGLQQQLETTGNAIRGEQDRLSIIERQIESLKAGATSDVAVPGMPATASPAAVRVVTLERQLAVLRGNYTDRHPEVVRVREELASARTEAAAEASRPAEERITTLRVDPNYRALIADQEQARLRIRELQRNESQIRAQIGMYRARVESAPRVEQQIATLQREYDLERQQYGELTSRLRTAEMNESLERNRGGEKFTILARAPLPTTPSSPNTQRLIIVALLLGLCAGGGLALGREYLDRSIHDTRALNDLELPVLGEIPRIANA
jgi:polysaccharide chain length determinant protein (PEP-CTERM system associated)